MGRKISLTGIITALLFSFSVQAQNSAAIRLNSLENDRSKVDQNGQSQWLHELNLGSEMMNLKEGSRLEVQLPRRLATLELISRNSFVEGTVSYVAVEKDGSDNKFMFTVKDDHLVGVYHSHSSEVLRFGHNDATEEAFMALSESTEDIACIALDASELGDLNVSERRSKKHPHQEMSSNNITAASMQASLNDDITIDIIVPYTSESIRAARNFGFLSAELVIAQILNLSQAALDQTRTGISLRLVHSYQTEYSEDGVGGAGMEAHLRRITSSPNFSVGAQFDGYMEEIHQLRREYGADLISLLVSQPQSGIAGIAWILNSVTGRPELGFSVNNASSSSVMNGYTVIHEFGHNFGNAHSRTQGTNATGPRGGLFQYSAGYQNFEDSVVTIMGYSQPGVQRVPVFSATDIRYNGISIGSVSAETPADSRRNNREIKRIIASYQPTVVNPPEFASSRSSVNVQVLPSTQSTVPVTISNSGNSDLVWDLDFEFGDTPISIPSRSKSSSRAVQSISEYQRAELNPGSQSLAKLSSSSVYATSFEESENFFLGESIIFNSWEAITTDDQVVEIRSERPSDGAQHLRLRNDFRSEPIFISSPYVGPLPLGKYRVDFSLRFSNPDSVSETYEFYLSDNRRQVYSSGIRIANSGGSVQTLGRGETGNAVFYSTNLSLQKDTYHDISIIYNTDRQQLEYYINDALIATNEYSTGLVPEALVFGTMNNGLEGTLDLDDFQVRLLEAPFSYLKVDRNSGVIRPGGSRTINLNIDSNNLDLGAYSSVLNISTNDPSTPNLEIPVLIDVSQTVSNEEGQDLPEALKLKQNYPNPFNPTTEIQYTVREPQNITIDVYSIHGQKVATLFNGFQNSGEFSVSFDASGLASGVYLYRLTGASASLTKRMVLIK